jgi:hypothetical protein
MSSNAPIVPPVHPACLNLFAGGVETLQDLLKRKELEHFVALVRRINFSQALIDNRINQDDIVLRHVSCSAYQFGGAAQPLSIRQMCPDTFLRTPWSSFISPMP